MKQGCGFNKFFIYVYLGVSLNLVQNMTLANSMCSKSEVVPITKNFGEIIPDSSDYIELIFPWKNNGDEILEIQKITRSCSCAQVRPRDGEIKPGENIIFVAKVDVSEWKGNAAISFAVFFKGKIDTPLYFKGTFYILKPLQAEPDPVSFGQINIPTKSFRHFKIEWAHDVNEAEMEILPNIFSDKGMVSCRVIEENKKRERLPNSDKYTIQQEFFFEVFLKPELPQGELDDVIRIPVLIDGKFENVLVRITGFYKGKLFATPSKLFAFISDSNKTDVAEIKTTLTLQDSNDILEDINVYCNNPNFSIVLTKGNVNTNKNLVGTITVTPNRTIAADYTETIKINYKINGRNEFFDIPIKILTFD